MFLPPHEHLRIVRDRQRSLVGYGAARRPAAPGARCSWLERTLRCTAARLGARSLRSHACACRGERAAAEAS